MIGAGLADREALAQPLAGSRLGSHRTEDHFQRVSNPSDACTACTFTACSCSKISGAHSEVLYVAAEHGIYSLPVVPGPAMSREPGRQTGCPATKSLLKKGAVLTAA